VGSIVPIEWHAKEVFAGPLSGYVVHRLKSSDEVLDMFSANVFDSKVIDHEAEGDWMDGMV
jgi:hypothetical protein